MLWNKVVIFFSFTYNTQTLKLNLTNYSNNANICVSANININRKL